MGASEAETIRQPRGRLKGQPQERHLETRDRLPPARGTKLTTGMDARRAETAAPFMNPAARWRGSHHHIHSIL
jgi:hypothetical protein